MHLQSRGVIWDTGIKIKIYFHQMVSEKWHTQLASYVYDIWDTELYNHAGPIAFLDDENVNLGGTCTMS